MASRYGYSARVDRYVDAVRTLRALEQAERDDGKTEERTRAIKQARDRAVELRRPLRGGDCGLAERILDGRA